MLVVRIGSQCKALKKGGVEENKVRSQSLARYHLGGTSALLAGTLHRRVTYDLLGCHTAVAGVEAEGGERRQFLDRD
jgi:hypothetical protein